MKQKILIVDLDGTLCCLKPETEKNNHTGNEQPIEKMIYLVQSIMQLDYIKVIILTGRKVKYQNQTIKWLMDNKLPVEIIMQEKSQADKNHIFKREKLINLQEKYDIIALIDDNTPMIPVCKELGIILLHVNL